MEPRRPDNIPGYVHPESNSVNSSGSVYKTFSDKKPRNKEQEQFGSTLGTTNYASYSDTTNLEMCPFCSDALKSICNCAYNDKTCVNGHVWYTARDGKIKKGNPHT